MKTRVRLYFIGNWIDIIKPTEKEAKLLYDEVCGYIGDQISKKLAYMVHIDSTLTISTNSLLGVALEEPQSDYYKESLQNAKDIKKIMSKQFEDYQQDESWKYPKEDEDENDCNN